MYRNKEHQQIMFVGRVLEIKSLPSHSHDFNNFKRSIRYSLRPLCYDVRSLDEVKPSGKIKGLTTVN